MPVNGSVAVDAASAVSVLDVGVAVASVFDVALVFGVALVFEIDEQSWLLYA